MPINQIQRSDLPKLFKLLTTSAAPILTRLLFTLAFVKVIATNGEAGSLANWGMVQNVVGLAAAIIGFSVQSGVASGVVTGYDEKALGRAMLIALSSTVVLLFLCLFSLSFSLEFFKGIPPVWIVLCGGFMAVHGFFVSYLPAKDKILELNIGYLVFGTVVLMSFYWVGFEQKLDQIASLLLAYSVCVVFFLLRAGSGQFLSVQEFLIDFSKIRTLLAFGVCSVANTIVFLSSIVLLRSEISQDLGQGSADIFEAGLRIIALIEASVGSVIGIMIWRLIDKDKAKSIRLVVMLSILSVVGVAVLFAGFLISGEFMVRLIFSEAYTPVISLYPWVFFVALIKVLISIILVPLFLARKIKHLIFSECLFLSGVLAVLFFTSSDLISVANSFQALAIGGICTVTYLVLCQLFLVKEV